MELDNLNISWLRDTDATHPRSNVSVGSLLPHTFHRNTEVCSFAAHGLAGEPSGDSSGFVHDVTAPCWADRCDTTRAPGVHTEETVGGSDLENTALVFRRRLLKQSQDRSMQGSCDREKDLLG